MRKYSLLKIHSILYHFIIAFIKNAICANIVKLLLHMKQRIGMHRILQKDLVVVVIGTTSMLFFHFSFSVTESFAFTSKSVLI